MVGSRVLAAVAAALVLVAAAGQASATELRLRGRAAGSGDARTYGGREDAMAFADRIAAEHGLDAARVRAQLAQARYLPRVAELVMPPPAGTSKNWAAYRDRFVEPTRIRAGVEWWRANARWLRLAEERFGVPAEIIVGIVGVETLYGRNMGGFRTLDALATLAFDFPAGRSDRSAFFRDELAALFVLGERSGTDPSTLRGSYAGALGMPQFMPSSLLKYAIDLDGDGVVDLHDSAADAIGSVANYLAKFGWQRGMPAVFEVSAPSDGTRRAELLAPDIVPTFSAEQFAERGAALDQAGQSHPGLLALVELENGDAAPSYVAGTANFYALTRYNWSSYYAMAVIELGSVVGRVVAATS